MTSVLVEFVCPKHGLERFKVKVIKKYNINPNLIMPRFRTKPKRELSGIIVGRNVEVSRVTDYLMDYFNSAGLINNVISIRLLI